MAEVPLMPERDFPYGNRGYPRERTTYGSGGVGFDRLTSTSRLGRGKSLAATIDTYVDTERRGWDSTA